MPVADIRVGVRDRADLGDLAVLQASITAIGLLHPVVVTEAGDLVAGGRRLAAVRGLGWESVPVTVVSFTTAAEVLRAEEDENTCRKPLTAYEAAQARERRARLLAPVARAQQAEAGQQYGRGMRPKASPNLGEASGARPDGRTAKVAAVGTGYSATTLDKVDVLRAVAERGVARQGRREVPVPEDVRAVAAEALEAVKQPGASVDAEHRKVRAALGAYLDASPEVQESRFLLSVARLTSQTIAGLPLLDAERVAELCEDKHLRLIQHAQTSLTEWVGQVEEARKRRRGLRVVGGGR
ncbi:ParB N-terminal domain-containing protein [Streptomyces erythrochromogenes]|uniref:ParB N-terminal domain-containing protein n=1 Tax=Streptomyces erythrochromogenes TaxID=285574 RepID=UPI00386A3245|nr:ParB N-terminal domain-containing protein [Streptomyces erythrochromogenes]